MKKFHQCSSIWCLTIILLLVFVSGNRVIYAAPSSWAVSEIKEAEQNGLVPKPLLNNYQSYITRAEFCRLVVRLYEKITGNYIIPVSENTFTDTSEPAVLKARALGIVYGIDESAGLFSPHTPVTRQETSVMICRTLSAINPALSLSSSSTMKLNDEADIASWARDAVHYLNEKQIMQGVQNNLFKPMDKASREQAIVLINRVYEKTPALTEQFILRGVQVGNSESQLIKKLGNPARIDKSSYGFDWYIYNQDYSKYLQVGVDSGRVVALYTNADFWVSKYGVKIGTSWEEVNQLYGENIDSKPEKECYDLGGLQLTVYYDIQEEYKISSIIIAHYDYIHLSSNLDDELKAAYEEEIFDITNSIRVRNGKKPFKILLTLAEIAEQHSENMAGQDFYDHYDLAGRDPGQRIADAGIQCTAWGENIAAGQTNAIEVVEAWMNSPGHRKKILGDYQYLGTGAAFGGYYGTYYTQDFCSL